MKYVLEGLALTAALVAAAACNADRLDIPNYNAPTTEGVAKDPQGIQLSATGMILAERNLYFARVRDVAVFGREGYFYFPTDARELAKIYQTIWDELASQYSLAYSSGNPKRDGAWRRIQVRLTRPNATARTKQGYYGPTGS